MTLRYSKEQLHQITEQAMIYMCACPAQVAGQLMALRELYGYQRNCSNKASVMGQVHQRIAQATRLAHAELESCLDDVLALEGWDKATLTMPEGLRQLRNQLIESGPD
ncbi:MAG: hypothetical protein B7Y41_05370 [Hydrogenophilales bacterium 28-61-23]|nr:MAG: hypothetical protein B7Y41_05370 [Hydrogenophilales bacterium 28-61-23]